MLYNRLLEDIRGKINRSGTAILSQIGEEMAKDSSCFPLCIRAQRPEQYIVPIFLP